MSRATDGGVAGANTSSFPANPWGRPGNNLRGDISRAICNARQRVRAFRIFRAGFYARSLQSAVRTAAAVRRQSTARDLSAHGWCAQPTGTVRAQAGLEAIGWAGLSRVLTSGEELLLHPRRTL